MYLFHREIANRHRIEQAQLRWPAGWCLFRARQREAATGTTESRLVADTRERNQGWMPGTRTTLGMADTLGTTGTTRTLHRDTRRTTHIRLTPATTATTSTSLRGVVSQQLLPTIHKPGRAAALEIMINTPAVSNLIRQGKLDQLETAMQAGGNVGMQTMDSALMALVEQARIAGKDAYQQANDKSKFQRMKDED